MCRAEHSDLARLLLRAKPVGIFTYSPKVGKLEEEDTSTVNRLIQE